MHPPLNTRQTIVSCLDTRSLILDRLLTTTLNWLIIFIYPYASSHNKSSLNTSKAQPGRNSQIVSRGNIVQIQTMRCWYHTEMFRWTLPPRQGLGKFLHKSSSEREGNFEILDISIGRPLPNYIMISPGKPACIAKDAPPRWKLWPANIWAGKPMSFRILTNYGYLRGCTSDKVG